MVAVIARRLIVGVVDVKLQTVCTQTSFLAIHFSSCWHVGTKFPSGKSWCFMANDTTVLVPPSICRRSGSNVSWAYTYRCGANWGRNSNSLTTTFEIQFHTTCSCSH